MAPTKSKTKRMPAKKEEGTVWVSPNGVLYTEPKIDADLIKKSRENKYIIEGISKQQRLIFRKGLKVELADITVTPPKVDEKESKVLMSMVKAKDVAIHNKIQLLWKDAMEFGCGLYNDVWEYNDSNTYSMVKLNRLPPETFENCGASYALIYNRILEGIRWNQDSRETEYWQTQADGQIDQLKNVGCITDPMASEVGGTPYIIPIIPFVNMLRFLWNKKMQEANIYGAGGLYFIKVKNPQGDDTEFAQKILNNESGDVRFQLRDNMELIAITVSGTGVAIEGIQEAQSQVQTFFTSSNLIAKDGTLIGGSSQPEFDLFMAYLESTHRWLEEAVREMLMPYLDGNNFDTEKYDIIVTIADLEYDKSQTLLSAVSGAFTTKSISLAERRKVYEKVGIETKELNDAEEKALLAEYEANNPPPAMSPMLQKVESLAKVISATPLDPHAFVSKEEMAKAIDGIGAGDKKSLPFSHSPPMKNVGGQSKKRSMVHGNENSGRYPRGSSGNETVDKSTLKEEGWYLEDYQESAVDGGSSVIKNVPIKNISQVEYNDAQMEELKAGRKVKEMASDIGSGLRLPVIEGSLGKDGKYIVVDGKHRVEAAKIAGKTTVPMLIPSSSMVHGGPGSGRYPAGSSGNEGSGLPADDQLKKDPSWGTVEGQRYTAYRGGYNENSLDDKRGGIFFAPDTRSSATYVEDGTGESVERYIVTIEKPLIATSQHELTKKFWDKEYSDMHYNASRRLKSEVEGGRFVDAKIAAKARSLKYKCIVYTDPMPPAHREICVLDKSIVKKASFKDDPTIDKFVHGGPGSGRYPSGSSNNESPSTEDAHTAVRVRTVDMNSNKNPRSALEQRSREIIKMLPDEMEWKDPRGRQIAEMAAVAHKPGMKTYVATDSVGKFAGLITHYNNADGINITYLASTGAIKHTGSELLKMAIRDSPGKDVNLFADPGAVTYYEHIGMHNISTKLSPDEVDEPLVVDDPDEPVGAVFHWSADEAKEWATSKVHGGPGSGRYPAGSGDNQKTKMAIVDINLEFQDMDLSPQGEKDVKEIMEAIKKGEPMPPILVSKSGYLQDGRHRLIAYKRLGYKEIPIVVGNHPAAKVHGGPGSGRYPAGSTNNEGTSNPKAYNTSTTRDGYSIRGGKPSSVKVRYDGDAKRWFVEVVDSDDSLLDIRGDNDMDRTYYEWGDNKKEALEYANNIQGWHGIPIQIESAGRVVQEIGVDGKMRNVDYKNDLKKMAKVSGEKPRTPFAKDTHSANKMAMKENTIKDNEFETGLIFNRDGEVVHTKIGTAAKGKQSASVPYTVDEKIMLRDKAKDEPLSFSHNHPGSGGPHSFNDYLFTRGIGLQECRVVNSAGTRYSIRPLEGKELPKLTKNQYAGVLFQVKQAFKKSGNFKLGEEAYDKKGNVIGRYTEISTHVKMHEETWKRMSDKYGFYFSEVV